MELPDAAYGAAQEFRELQQAAPLTGPQAGAQGLPGPNLTPLSAGTTRPGEPVTSGAAYGPGPGPEILGLGTPADRVDAQEFKKYMPVFIQLAQEDDTPQSVKNLVRRLVSTS